MLVLPGLGASDASTRPLRVFLRDRGYRAHGWKLGSAIFSRTDGVVAWQGCMEREGPTAENIEVEGQRRRFGRGGLRGLVYPDAEKAS